MDDRNDKGHFTHASPGLRNPLLCDSPRHTAPATQAVSFTSFPGVGGFGTGNVDPTPYLSFGWVVPAALFPGGRTQSVTVPLNAPGTKYLPRWNQLDISVKRVIHTRRVDIQPVISVFNVLNSSVVLNEIQTFGSALEQPLNTLQGRFMKLEALIKF